MHAPPLLSALVAGSAYSEACRRDRLPLWPTEARPSTAGPLPLIQYCFRTYGGARGSRLNWQLVDLPSLNTKQRPAGHCESNRLRDSTVGGRTAMLPHLRVSVGDLVSRDLHRRLTSASRYTPLPSEALVVNLRHASGNAANAPLRLL